MINSMFSGPTFSVIVSSYNYQDYVIDAVESALNQSYPPLEVIVVDDGSSDESQERLKARFGEDPRVLLLTQSNQGQLAAWIAGFNRSIGDIIAPLDSDDLWEPNYLASMASVYQRERCIDVVYCNLQLFGAREGLMLNRGWQCHDRDLGTSVLLGCFYPKWQGVATSGNTVRRDLMARILDLPADQISQWRTRPDDCIFYGSDILGGRKIYLSAALAHHREHPNNALLADKTPIRRLQYELRRERMLAHYRRQIDAGPRLLVLAKTEFRTKPQPTIIEFWLYFLMAARAPDRLSRRIGYMLSIAGHFLSCLQKIKFKTT